MRTKSAKVVFDKHGDYLGVYYVVKEVRANDIGGYTEYVARTAFNEVSTIRGTANDCEHFLQEVGKL